MSDTELSAGRLVGIWRLVDARTVAVDTGETQSAYGDGAKGFIHYTKAGRMIAFITHGGRSRMSGTDRQNAPDAEMVAAYKTTVTYAGRYSVKGDAVHHHIDMSSFENWVGTDLVRFVQMRGDRVVLKTAQQPQAGILSVLELEWERCE